MRRGLYRTTVVAVGCVVAALVSGCGAGQQAQTAQQVTMTNGAEGRVGTVMIRDAQFGADLQPVAGDVLFRPGQDAYLQLTITNGVSGAAADALAPDRLVEVRSPIARSSRIIGDARVTDGEALVAGYQRPGAAITVPGAREIGIVLMGLTEPLRPAMTYPVEFTFARAGTLRMELPVENPVFLPPRAGERAVYPLPGTGGDVGTPVAPREAVPGFAGPRPLETGE